MSGVPPFDAPDPRVEGIAVDLSVVGEEWGWDEDAIVIRITGQRRDDNDAQSRDGAQGAAGENNLGGDLRSSASGLSLPVHKVSAAEDLIFAHRGKGTGGRCGFHEGSQSAQNNVSEAAEERLGSPVQDTSEAVGIRGGTMRSQSSEVPVREGDGEGDAAAVFEAVPADYAPESIDRAEVLLQTAKRKPWRKWADKVQASVQRPPPGSFSRVDLLWEVKSNVGNGKRRETQKATIPWDRLDDFLEGEMSGRQHPCTFVEESKKTMKKIDRKQVRAESAVQEIRFISPHYLLHSLSSCFM